MTTVRDATRELMRGLGMTTVFGNPGTTEVPFLSDWPDDFRFVLGLQESVVVAMADGYAQLTGQPVLVSLHSAGGVGHALGSIVTAFRNRTPMVVLAGQQARELLGDDPFLGAVDATAFPRPYVKWSHEPARAADVPAAFARAWSRAAQAPSGPVFLSVPVDDWDAPAAAVPVPARPAPSVPHPDAVRALAAALYASNAPALVVGPAVDADGAIPQVVTLAERLGAPVWASPLSARCSFPEDHPLFAGFLPAERVGLSARLAGHDLLLVLGAPAFTYHVLRPGTPAPTPPMVLVSDDEDVLARAPGARGIRAGAGDTVRALLAATPAAPRVPPLARTRPPRPEPSSPLTAAFVLDAVARTLPPDALVVEEAPSHRDALHEHLPIRLRRAGFLTTASGALGYGIAAAVGAALARPERRVVAVLGDGSSMYGIQALWTAARHGTPVTFVVLDNAEYAAVRLLGEAAGGRKLPGTELGGIDFVAVAEGLGCRASAVHEAADLEPALVAALAVPGPALLHVTVGREPAR